MLGGQNLAALAKAEGTPLYVYDVKRVFDNLDRIRDQLQAVVRHGEVFYAMKSNRHPGLLAALKANGKCGIDVCSPGELELARAIGFEPRQLSYTGTAMSADDLAALSRRPDVTLNLDSRAALRRLAAVSPGHRIGLRVNPQLGVGYRQNKRLRYAGSEITKFGIAWRELPEALDEAKQLGLIVDGLHVHAGCGFLNRQLPGWERIVARIADLAKGIPGLRYVNLGGGFGIPLVATDRPLDLKLWGEVLKRHLGRARFEVWIEPGDYLVKDAGVLLLEVNDVEQRAGQWFVGLNGGFNLHPEPVFYDLPLWPLPVRVKTGKRQRFHLAGNINEVHDVWAKDVRHPLPEGGDVWALLNAGGYGAAMSSDHCRRGQGCELLIWS